MKAERISLDHINDHKTLKLARIEDKEDCLLRTKSTLFLRNGLPHQKIYHPVVIAINDHNLNFYTIQNKQLKFLSQRRVILPIDAPTTSSCYPSSTNLIILVKNEDIQKTKKETASLRPIT